MNFRHPDEVVGSIIKMFDIDKGIILQKGDCKLYYDELDKGYSVQVEKSDKSGYTETDADLTKVAKKFVMTAKLGNPELTKEYITEQLRYIAKIRIDEGDSEAADSMLRKLMLLLLRAIKDGNCIDVGQCCNVILVSEHEV